MLYAISVYDFLIANMHAAVASTDDHHGLYDAPLEPDTSSVDSDASNNVRLINAAKSNGTDRPFYQSELWSNKNCYLEFIWNSN